MNSKSTSMFYFVVALLVLGPIGVVAAVLCLGWAWQSISGCFFSGSYSCGQVEWFKAFIFGAIAYGCLNGISTLWNKTK